MTMLERLLHGLTLAGSVIQRDADDGPFVITVHLDEQIYKSGRRLIELRVSDRGLEATATPLPREVYDPADGPFQWIAAPRADREQE